MILKAGDHIWVAFIIDSNAVTVNCVFTGEYVTLNDEKLFFLTNKNSGAEYTFTATQLGKMKVLNDPASRGAVEELNWDELA